MKKNKKKTEAPVKQETDILEESVVDAETEEFVAETDELGADVYSDDVDGDENLPDIELADDDEEVVDPMALAIAALEAERDELKDQNLRARAEFDNYRKRMARENDRIRKTAAEGLMRNLLPIVDNLERALSHVEDKSDGLALGVEMIVKQFADVLSGAGLEPIPAKGEVFDPNIHEALTHQPSDEFPADTVMEEFQRGYRLSDFVLRPTQVVVSSGPLEPVAAEENSDATAENVDASESQQ